MTTTQRTAIHHGAGEILQRMDQTGKPRILIVVPRGETAWWPKGDRRCGALGSSSVIVGPAEVEYSRTGTDVIAMPLGDAAVTAWGTLPRRPRRLRR
jgi:hypothetical protein